MGDLFKALFEDTPEPDDDLVRLLEAAERVEKLEVKKQPLADVLKSLKITGGDAVATPDGIKVVFSDDAEYHAACKLLGTLEIITQLAGHGWVPIVSGDTAPGDESPKFEVNFFEIDDIPLSSATEAPSSEDLALTAMKFNGFADQDEKAVQPPMQGNARGLVKGKKKNESSNASGVTRPITDLPVAQRSSDGVITLKDGSKWRPCGNGNATCVLPTQVPESKGFVLQVVSLKENDTLGYYVSDDTEPCADISEAYVYETRDEARRDALLNQSIENVLKIVPL